MDFDMFPGKLVYIHCQAVFHFMSRSSTSLSAAMLWLERGKSPLRIYIGTHHILICALSSLPFDNLKNNIRPMNFCISLSDTLQ